MNIKTNIADEPVKWTVWVIIEIRLDYSQSPFAPFSLGLTRHRFTSKKLPNVISDK